MERRESSEVCGEEGRRWETDQGKDEGWSSEDFYVSRAHNDHSDLCNFRNKRTIEEKLSQVDEGSYVGSLFYDIESYRPSFRLTMLT